MTVTRNCVALLLFPLSNATFNLLSFQVKCQDVLGSERQTVAFQPLPSLPALQLVLHEARWDAALLRWLLWSSGVSRDESFFWPGMTTLIFQIVRDQGVPCCAALSLIFTVFH